MVRPSTASAVPSSTQTLLDCVQGSAQSNGAEHHSLHIPPGSNAHQASDETAGDDAMFVTLAEIFRVCTPEELIRAVILYVRVAVQHGVTHIALLS